MPAGVPSANTRARLLGAAVGIPVQTAAFTHSSVGCTPTAKRLRLQPAEVTVEVVKGVGDFLRGDGTAAQAAGPHPQ